MNYPYHCKFCKKPGIVTCDDRFTDMFKIEKWLAMICCERCGKYMESKRSVQEAIRECAISLVRIKQARAEQKNSEMMGKIREALDLLCLRFAEIVCDYFKVQTVFEPEFVQVVYDRPQNSMAALDRYIRGVRSISATP